MSRSTFPPRGSGIEHVRESPPKRVWAHPDKLDPSWDWTAGKIVLGRSDQRALGDPDRSEVGPGSGDDRHIVTVAGSRAGKSSTVLVPNLLHYPGSVIVIDPKGELAKNTALHRKEVLRHHVAVLDPFGTSGQERSSYNPLDDLDPHSDTYVDDVGLLADALIVDTKGDPHWSDSAKNLIAGLLFYIITLAFVELERDQTEPAFPVLFMLEEFGTLGYLRPIEYLPRPDRHRSGISFDLAQRCPGTLLHGDDDHQASGSWRG